MSEYTCQCSVVYHVAGPDRIIDGIEYCPTHAAAPDLLAALVAVGPVLEAAEDCSGSIHPPLWVGPHEASLPDAAADALAWNRYIIAKATGQSESAPTSRT